MNVARRGLLVLATCASAVAAHATLNFSNIEANITFEDSTTSALTVLQHDMGLDIFAGNMPMYVDNANSSHTSATVTVSYDATSTTSINQLDLMFTGWAQNSGQITYSEQVFDSQNNLLDSVSGTMGSGNPFIQTDTLNFAGTTSFHVTKTFTLDLNGGLGNQSGSIASLGIIQQNAVPEPASMAALAMGGLGLLARRRRK